ncbi:hypothetical protein [Sediminibacterium goheungense]|uniref:Uncharacterized protein n=1 Tax=Sediminibacterium goheungense TaxID=1086393 RepID=A0A4R6IWF3_9BACT|nr:hypothetical protein [Sediminibacterium goheungense]TDO27039.1 hypothetical protein BC659_2356 [Sediminibacterium goheungense]
MNQLTTYEQLIADKLQQLPVPDMADAIWASIEQRLDVEMPEDPSGPSSGGNHSLPGFQFPGRIMLYCFLAAFISVVFYLNRPGRASKELSLSSSDGIAPSTIVVDDQKKPTPPERQQETIFKERADLPVDKFKEDKLVEKEWPVSENPITEIKTTEIPAKQETSPISETILAKKVITQQDTIPKKKRGVIGITSSDYRIAPVRKDSL